MMVFFFSILKDDAGHVFTDQENLERLSLCVLPKPVRGTGEFTARADLSICAEEDYYT